MSLPVSERSGDPPSIITVPMLLDISSSKVHELFGTRTFYGYQSCADKQVTWGHVCSSLYVDVLVATPSIVPLEHNRSIKSWSSFLLCVLVWWIDSLLSNQFPLPKVKKCQISKSYLFCCFFPLRPPNWLLALSWYWYTSSLVFIFLQVPYTSFSKMRSCVGSPEPLSFLGFMDKSMLCFSCWRTCSSIHPWF